MPKRKKKIIVIGGGLAGLSLAMKICERNAEVVIVSYQSLKRSHSVCAQGGINAAIDARNEGDSPENHFYDTIKGGDFLAQKSVATGSRPKTFIDLFNNFNNYSSQSIYYRFSIFTPAKPKCLSSSEILHFSDCRITNYYYY